MKHPHESHADVVVIGCGPAGSVAAAELARAGLRVIALDRADFPRYHIGESLTTSAGIMLREFALSDELDARDFPVKTGVKVIGKGARNEFFVPVLEPTWQVQRDGFDQLLLDRARAHGVEFRRGAVEEILRSGEAVTGVAYRPQDASGDDGEPLRRIHARFVVDASGLSTLLSQKGVAGRRVVEDFGRQIAVFSQFRGALRDPGEMGNNTFIFYSEMHHWSWFIPLSSELVSVGVVMPAQSYKRYGDSPEAVFAWGTRNINPDLRRRLEGIEPCEPVRVIRNYSYRVDPFAGPGWLCVGDAHRFTDPIFSFGVSFAMTEARAATQAILAALEAGDCRVPFEKYQRYCDRGQDAAHDVIRYFWRFPAFFGYLARGEQRGQLIQLLSGNCFGEEPLPVLESMRRSLNEVPTPRTDPAPVQRGSEA